MLNKTLSALEWPKQNIKMEVDWFEFQPGDGTKYVVGIIEHTYGFFVGTKTGNYHQNNGEDFVTIIYDTGYYSFPKTEFELEEPHEGTLIYFMEKMKTIRQTSKMLCRFIHQMLYKREAFLAIKALNK